jgi:hypothetical protein
MQFLRLPKYPAVLLIIALRRARDATLVFALGMGIAPFLCL